MKRSAMISKIHSKLHGIRPEINYAQQILEIVEEAGMLPPVFFYDPQQTDSSELNAQGKLISKWENE